MLVRENLVDILYTGSFNEKIISLFSCGSLTSSAMGKEPSNFSCLTLEFFDEESRVRIWVESLWMCGFLFRG